MMQQEPDGWRYAGTTYLEPQGPTEAADGGVVADRADGGLLGAGAGR